MTISIALLVAALLQTGAMPVQPMTTVAKGAQSGVESPRQVVVRTEAEWATLWQEHARDQHPHPQPNIDFTREMVVGVFIGTRSTGGFGVEIVGIREDRGSLIVDYRETRPGRDRITAQVITAPYHLVRIPRFSGEVRFEKLTSS